MTFDSTHEALTGQLPGVMAQIAGQAAAFGGSFTSVNLPTNGAADAVDALRNLKNKE